MPLPGIFWLAISSVLALVVAIGVAASPRSARREAALWGLLAALMWPALLISMAVDALAALVTRLAKRFTRR